MPGFNGTLNAFEFYGGIDVDKFVLMWGDFLEPEYKEQFPQVTFINIEKRTEWYPGKKAGFYLRMYPLQFMLDELFDSYDVVLLWGGDVTLVNDISDFFHIAHHLNKMVVGTNEHGSYDLERLGTVWPYKHGWGVPFADIPWFTPKGRKDVIQKMIDYLYMEGDTLGQMDRMNYAIRDCGGDDIVFPVPGELWVQNVPYRLQLTIGKYNKIKIYGSTSELFSFHRKYWSRTACIKYLPNPVSNKNKHIFNKTMNFLNRECRVKWEKGLEIWDGVMPQPAK
jgi:hypothetical protein